MNDLEGFSKAVKHSADLREQERVEANDARGPAHYFVPDADQENQEKGFGIGYWVIGQNVVAYQRMANGYQRYPLATYSIEWLRRLVKLWEGRQ